MYLTPMGIILKLLNHFVKMIKMTILTSVIEISNLQTLSMKIMQSNYKYTFELAV